MEEKCVREMCWRRLSALSTRTLHPFTLFNRTGAVAHICLNFFFKLKAPACSFEFVCEIHIVVVMNCSLDDDANDVNTKTTFVSKLLCASRVAAT